MAEYLYQDALTGSSVALDDTGLARVVERAVPSESCHSLYFPGCSFINYAVPLMEALYQTLQQHELVDGISLLCCGKILSYEPDGEATRARFEQQLRERLAQSAVERIVVVCPNCAKALSEALAADESTASIAVVPALELLADVGYQIDREQAAALLGKPGESITLCPHDSCPDRESGDFARALRRLLPADSWKEPAHSFARSLCCGSLLRAAGKYEAADKLSQRNIEEAQEVQADAVVTACFSCAFQLSMTQQIVPVVHGLELLYNWRINWAQAGAWMKTRFLIEETEAPEVSQEESGRSFVALCDTTAPLEQNADEVIADEASLRDEEARMAAAILEDLETTDGQDSPSPKE